MRRALPFRFYGDAWLLGTGLWAVYWASVWNGALDIIRDEEPPRDDA